MIKDRASQDPFNVAATLIFVLAVIHTFVATLFRQISHKLEKQHLEKHGEDTESVSFWAVVFHFFGEVEAVFGLWVFALGGPFVLLSWYSAKQWIASLVLLFVTFALGLVEPPAGA